MYQVTREKRIAETVRINGTDGQYVDFTTDISVDDIFREYTEILKSIERGRAVLEHAQNAGDADAVAETYENIGSLVCALMRMTFGTENGAKLLLLYKNAYVELLGDIMPFIREVVAPKIAARLEEQTRKYTAER